MEGLYLDQVVVEGAGPVMKSDPASFEDLVAKQSHSLKLLQEQLECPLVSHTTAGGSPSLKLHFAATPEGMRWKGSLLSSETTHALLESKAPTIEKEVPNLGIEPS